MAKSDVTVFYLVLRNRNFLNSWRVAESFTSFGQLKRTAKALNRDGIPFKAFRGLRFEYYPDDGIDDSKINYIDNWEILN